MRFFSRQLEVFKQSDSGQVAAIFALLTIPLLLIAGGAIDMHNTTSERVRLSAALDSAALSAVANQGLTETERGAYASQVFWDNMGGPNASVQLSVLDAQDTRVSLEATAEITKVFGLMDNDGKASITENAAAELTYGEVVCMMALAPNESGAFEVTQGGKLSAADCSVQVNSSHVNAASVAQGGRALAKNFCVAGGAAGDFDPFVNTECRALPDPFADKRYEEDQPCVDAVALEETLSAWPSSSTGVTLDPGTYCGGLVLSGKIVTFSPGTYVIKDGPFLLDQGSRVEAEDVTFILQGEEAVFTVRNGAVANIKAPSTGKFAGLAFFQDIHTNSKNFKNLPTGETTIEKGSFISVVGIVYLPEQKLAFRGGSSLQNQAPATSFIGHTISISKGSVVGVAVDHQAAGIPPIEPRLDESVRLTQ